MGKGWDKGMDNQVVHLSRLLYRDGDKGTGQLDNRTCPTVLQLVLGMGWELDNWTVQVVQ